MTWGGVKRDALGRRRIGTFFEARKLATVTLRVTTFPLRVYGGIAHFVDVADLSEYVAPALQRETGNPIEIA